jgi:hypothetical protein
MASSVDARRFSPSIVGDSSQLAQVAGRLLEHEVRGEVKAERAWQALEVLAEFPLTRSTIEWHR